MNCLNCNHQVSLEDNYCPNCGAKVIKERLTVKGLFRIFTTSYLGWDNKFLRTLWHLLIAPKKVIGNYLQGQRKFYMAPLAFVALGIAISVFLYAQINFQEYMSNTSGQAFQDIVKSMNPDMSQEEVDKKVKEMSDSNKKFMGLYMKYFNVISFLLIPVYSFICFIAFGRKQNYAEHLIINLYAQGFISFVSLVFLAAFFIAPEISVVSSLIFIPYYLYVYGKLNGYKLKEYIGRFLWFGFVSISFFVFISLLVGIIFLALKLLSG